MSNFLPVLPILFTAFLFFALLDLYRFWLDRRQINYLVKLCDSRQVPLFNALSLLSISQRMVDKIRKTKLFIVEENGNEG